MADGPADSAASIGELQALLLGTESIDEFLRELAVLAARTLGPGIACGITLQPNGKPLTVASSDTFASQADELQYGLGQGPCLSALRTGKQVRIDDLAADDRWRKYGVRALAHGVRASLSLPLSASGRSVGAFNFYSREPGFFGAGETRHAERFAQNASVAVGLAARMAAHAELAEHLRASLASRSVIDQAIGVLMAEQRCSSAEAFAILRNASQNRNIKLRQVAQNIVAGVSEPARPASVIRSSRQN